MKPQPFVTDPIVLTCSIIMCTVVIPSSVWLTFDGLHNHNYVLVVMSILSGVLAVWLFLWSIRDLWETVKDHQ